MENKENNMATATKEVAAQGTNLTPVIGAETFGDFYEDVELTQQDMIVPTIKLMQATTELVKDDKAAAGEYRKSTGELLAEKNDELELIIFKLDKYFAINQMEMGQNGKEKVPGTYRREEFNVDLAREWEFAQDGKEYRRELVYSFYVLVANSNGQEVFNQVPSIISFRSSAKKAAKTWLSKLQNMRASKQEPHSHVFLLGRSKETKGKNSWLIPTVSVGRPTTKDEQAAVTLWRNEFKTKEINIHGEEEGD